MKKWLNITLLVGWQYWKWIVFSAIIWSLIIWGFSKAVDYVRGIL